MDYSITFARHFSRLLWLLLHESGNVDEQKAALRAVVTVSRDGAVTLATQDYRLVVNGSALPDALTGVQDLAAQLIGHAISDVRIQQNAAPADLLGFARILASEPLPGNGGPAVLERLAAVGANSLAVTLRTLHPIAPAAESRPSTSGPPDAGASPAADTRPARTSASTTPRSEPPSMRRTAGAPIRDHPSGVHPVIEPRSMPRPGSRGGSRAGSRGESRSAPSAVRATRSRGGTDSTAPTGSRRPSNGSPEIVPGIVTDEASGRFLAFAAVHAPKGRVADTLAKLDAATSAAMTTRILDELVAIADEAGRDARAPTVADVCWGVLERETRSDDSDQKRAFAMTLRRLSKPTLLRLIATLLPRDRDRAEQYTMVLARAGEDGAEALIEQLTSAKSLSDRRVFFDALVTLHAGVPALMHMLGDPRWYVVRNAADLLGELQATEAETPLTDAVRHDDDRVRRAAAAALAKLGTPRAHHALREALRDNSSQVRMQAALGLATLKQSRQATTLARALDSEADEDVQVAILTSLGRVGTPDAVQKLVKAAEPDGRLFRKKSTAYRVAAVQALVDAKTPEAMAALAGLAADKEREVREIAAKAIDDGTN